MFVNLKTQLNNFMLQNEGFVFIRKIHENKLLCDVFKKTHLKTFFTEPCESQLININYIENMDNVEYTRKLLQRCIVPQRCLHSLDTWMFTQCCLE